MVIFTCNILSTGIARRYRFVFWNLNNKIQSRLRLIVQKRNTKNKKLKDDFTNVERNTSATDLRGDRDKEILAEIMIFTSNTWSRNRQSIEKNIDIPTSCSRRAKTWSSQCLSGEKTIKIERVGVSVRESCDLEMNIRSETSLYSMSAGLAVSRSHIRLTSRS